MSKGMRCDGCKEMIDDDDYLELDHMGKRDDDSYTRSLESAHFHGYNCIYRFMHAPGYNERFFGREMVDEEAG
jgi:hypothetical protein